MLQFLELKIPPVVQAAIVTVVMWTSAAAFPQMDMSVPASRYLAGILASAGTIIAILGVHEFRKVNTTVDPRFPDKSVRLVDVGVYRYSRNPMYLGMFLVLTGFACYLTNFLSFLLLPLFVAYINRFQILPEERVMLQKFGEEFRDYSSSVRRWI